MSRKIALVIGNSEYEDQSLARLITPSEDVADLVTALQSPDIGGFDEVVPLINESATSVRKSIARLFKEKSPDDLLLLYFSGHGVLDDQGQLYLAVRDTERDLLSGTAIPASFVTSEMDRSRSKRQVLILDCCHSGAFARGAKGAPGASVGTASAFEGTGYGRVVLTASDATQYAWEGNQVIGQAENSVFTHFMIQGLQTGEADIDADGRITLDELYDYVYSQVVTRTPKQTPGKWSYKQQGDLVIAKNPRPIVKPTDLPSELKQAIESPFASVREGVVRELDRLLNGSNTGLSLAASEALKHLVDDDSRRVSAAASASLAAYAEKQRAREELAKQRAEEERLAREKAEQERLAREKAAADRRAALKAEEERLAREQAERARLEKEKAEADRLAALKAEGERLAKQRAEEERLAREKAEQERLAKEKAEADRLAALKAEEARLAREAQRAEEERLAREKAEQERLAKEKAEAERLAAQKVEQERLAKEKAEAEHLVGLKAEQERLAREKAEADRLAALRTEEERLAQQRVEEERAAHKVFTTEEITDTARRLAVLALQGHLIVKKGPDTGKNFALKAGDNIIGRVGGLDITIADALISRRHVRIHVQSDRITLEDLGSANGTFVNSQKVGVSTPMTLKDGDTIEIGDTTLEFKAAAIAMPLKPIEPQPIPAAQPETIIAAPTSSIAAAIARPTIVTALGFGVTWALAVASMFNRPGNDPLPYIMLLLAGIVPLGIIVWAVRRLRVRVKWRHVIGWALGGVASVVVAGFVAAVFVSAGGSGNTSVVGIAILFGAICGLIGGAIMSAVTKRIEPPLRSISTRSIAIGWSAAGAIGCGIALGLTNFSSSYAAQLSLVWAVAFGGAIIGGLGGGVTFWQIEQAHRRAPARPIETTTAQPKAGPLAASITRPIIVVCGGWIVSWVAGVTWAQTYPVPLTVMYASWAAVSVITGLILRRVAPAIEWKRIGQIAIGWPLCLIVGTAMAPQNNWTLLVGVAACGWLAASTLLPPIPGRNWLYRGVAAAAWAASWPVGSSNAWGVALTEMNGKPGVTLFDVMHYRPDVSFVLLFLGAILSGVIGGRVLYTLFDHAHRELSTPDASARSKTMLDKTIARPVLVIGGGWIALWALAVIVAQAAVTAEDAITRLRVSWIAVSLLTGFVLYRMAPNVQKYALLIAIGWPLCLLIGTAIMPPTVTLPLAVAVCGLLAAWALAPLMPSIGWLQRLLAAGVWAGCWLISNGISNAALLFITFNQVSLQFIGSRFTTFLGLSSGAIIGGVLSSIVLYWLIDDARRKAVEVTAQSE